MASPRRRPLAPLAPLLVGLVVLSGCGAAPDVATDTEVVVVRTGNLADAPTLFALERGHFTDEGVTVRAVESRGGSEMIAALVAGEVDVLYVALNPGLLGSLDAEGSRHRAVTATAVVRPEECAYLGVAASADMAARLDAGEPLTGPVRIGWFGTALLVDEYVGVLMAELGAAGAEPTVVRLDRASQTAALAAGEIDLGVETEPALTIAAERAGGGVRLPAAGRVRGPMSALVFSARLLADEDLAGRVMRAWLRGLDDYRDGPTPDAVALLAEVTAIEPELLRTMCWPAITADATGSAAEFDLVQRRLVELGAIDRVVPADRIWDGGPLERAGGSGEDR